MGEQLETRSRRPLLIGGLLSGMLLAVGLGLIWVAALSPRPLAHAVLTSSLLLTGLLGLLFSLAAHFKAQKTVLEAAIQSQEALDAVLHSALASTPDVFIIKDLDGRIQAISPAGAALLGKRPNDLIGKTEREIFGEETAERFRAHDLAVLQANGPQQFEESLVTPDGKEHVFLGARFPYWAPDGTPRGIIAILHEITDRLHEETTRRRLAAIVTASLDAIVSVNPQDQTVQLWNPGSERLFGYSAAEAIGKPFAIVVPPERLEETRQYFKRVLSGETLAPFESVRVAKNGRRLDVWVSLFAVRDDQGRILSMTAIVRDLTEFRRVQAEMARRTAELQKAKELNQLKDHFLSTLSHEIKTPLSLICGYAELLEEKYPGEALLEGVLDGTRRLNEHITNLLEYSAVLSGTLPLYPSEINLAEVGRHVVQLVAAGVREHGLSLMLDIDPTTPPILGDFRRISQVILKLVENAEKFTPAGGQVGIRIGPSGEEVRIDVWDTGPGIPEAQFGRIWQAFTQLEIADAQRKGGLGLGLTMVKKLTELHGGRVALVSHPGRGSTFTVYLPVSMPARVGAPAIRNPDEQRP
jgi:PAS domain S-box-containing protein